MLSADAALERGGTVAPPGRVWGSRGRAGGAALWAVGSSEGQVRLSRGPSCGERGARVCRAMGRARGARRRAAGQGRERPRRQCAPGDPGECGTHRRGHETPGDSGGRGGRREARGETLKRREDRSVDSCDPTRVLRSAGRDHRRHPRGRSGGVAGAPAGGGCLPGGGGRGGESRRPWNPTETHGCRATSGEFGSLSGEILRHSGVSPTWRTWPLSSHRSATLTPACRRSRTRWTPSKRRYVALAAACVGRPRPTPRWFWKVLSVDCSSPGLTCGVRR